LNALAASLSFPFKLLNDPVAFVIDFSVSLIALTPFVFPNSLLKFLTAFVAVSNFFCMPSISFLHALENPDVSNSRRALTIPPLATIVNSPFHN